MSDTNGFTTSIGNGMQASKGKQPKKTTAASITLYGKDRKVLCQLLSPHFSRQRCGPDFYDRPYQTVCFAKLIPEPLQGRRPHSYKRTSRTAALTKPRQVLFAIRLMRLDTDRLVRAKSPRSPDYRKWGPSTLECSELHFAKADGLILGRSVKIRPTPWREK